MGNGCFYADRLAAGYGKRSVAEGLSFHAGRGEIVTLIGPNGAGKSTILKTISGGLAPMGGELVLDGVPMERIPRKERARKLAVVFTEKLQGELMTCRDVTAAGRYPYTGRLGLLSEKDQRAVDQALELVHGTDLGTVPLTGSATAAPADHAGQGALPGAGDDPSGRAHLSSGCEV